MHLRTSNKTAGCPSVKRLTQLFAKSNSPPLVSTQWTFLTSSVEILQSPDEVFIQL